MKVVFIHGGSRWRYDEARELYVDQNLNNAIFYRYKKFCSELFVILRKDSIVYSSDYATSHFNKVDTNIFNCIALDDIYKPKKNYLSLQIRNRIKSTISDIIRISDRVIIREPGSYYAHLAIFFARKYKVPYLLEITSNVFDSYWYHGMFGKIRAILTYPFVKFDIFNAPFVLYVTKSYLQKYYPTKGKCVGVSDCQIKRLDYSDFENKEIKKNADDKLIMGTAAYLDVDYKGQKDVIKALSLLKKEGISCFEYHLLGNGTGKSLLELAKKCGCSELVKIDGCIPHEKINEWYGKLDIYIQPSYQEGLCRSIVEAISRGCPVICSNIEGNFEMVPNENCFERGNVKEIKELLVKFISFDVRKKSALYGYNVSMNFDDGTLSLLRNNFYSIFFET